MTEIQKIHITEIQIIEIPKYKLHKYKITNYINTNYWSTKYRSAETQIKGIQKYKWEFESSPIIKSLTFNQKFTHNSTVYL